MDMFTVIAAVVLLINVSFLVGSLIYTVKVTKKKGDRRLSSLGSVLDPRLSLQPQVVLYDAIVRMSGNPSLSEQQITEKTESQTKQAA